MVASDLETAKKRSVVPPPRRLSSDSEKEEGEGGNQQFSGGARALAVKTMLIFGVVSSPATPVLTRRRTASGAESGRTKVITLRL